VTDIPTGLMAALSRDLLITSRPQSAICEAVRPYPETFLLVQSSSRFAMRRFEGRYLRPGARPESRATSVLA
jgi:hypothetical protein